MFDYLCFVKKLRKSQPPIFFRLFVFFFFSFNKAQQTTHNNTPLIGCKSKVRKYCSQKPWIVTLSLLLRFLGIWNGNSCHALPEPPEL